MCYIEGVWWQAANASLNLLSSLKVCEATHTCRHHKVSPQLPVGCIAEILRMESHTCFQSLTKKGHVHTDALIKP